MSNFDENKIYLINGKKLNQILNVSRVLSGLKTLKPGEQHELGKIIYESALNFCDLPEY